MFEYLKSMPLDERRRLQGILETNYIQHGTCWNWRGDTAQGYGVIGKHRVHRLSYALFVTDFHKSHFICHKCNNPLCYNPAHLYAGDYKTNAADRVKHIKASQL
jgi:hypothetical protein